MKKSKDRKDGKASGNMFDRLDLFSVPMPTHNFEGNSQIGTSIGFLFSILLVTIVLVYALLIGRVFVTGDKPKVATVL
jgi:hypothetical protein